MTPGSTLIKSKHQDGRAYGQIIKPGLPVADGDGGTDGIVPPHTKKIKAARPLLVQTDLVTSSSDGGGSSSSSDSGAVAGGTSDATVVTKPAAPRKANDKLGVMMHVTIEAGDDFTALVKARCGWA
jgi:hypothetical protein